MAEPDISAALPTAANAAGASAAGNKTVTGDQATIGSKAAAHAMRDPVTGLPNRELFHDRLMVGISLAKRHEWLLAIMYVSLDQLKPFSQAYGAERTDAALQSLASRLFNRARGGDTISSSGDDKLLYMLINPGTRENIRRVAQRVRDRLLLPVDVDEVSLLITPRIGIAVYPDDGLQGDVLVVNAQLAMHEARSRNLSYLFHEPRPRVEVPANTDNADGAAQSSPGA